VHYSPFICLSCSLPSSTPTPLLWQNTLGECHSKAFIIIGDAKTCTLSNSASRLFFDMDSMCQTLSVTVPSVNSVWNLHHPPQGWLQTDNKCLSVWNMNNRSVLVFQSLTRCVPGVGLYFSSLHWLKSNVTSGDPGPVEAIFLGMLARSLSGVCLIPITVIKTRFEVC
jgi:hypothetical protein